MRLAEALEVLKIHQLEVGTETISLPEANGRIVAEDVYAPRDFPPWPISAMDGIAVRFSENRTFAIVGQVNAGDEGNVLLKPGEGVRVNTGAVIPENADAVIKIEDIKWIDKKTIEATKEVKFGKNIIEKGENVRKGTLTIKKGQTISSSELATLRAFGTFSVKVFRKPIIGILNTGDELQDAPPLKKGKTIETNSIMLKDLIRKCHGHPLHFGSIQDKEIEIEAALNKLLGMTDILIIVGGTSMGTRDLIPKILDRKGSRIFKGLNISPGKPVGAWKISKNVVFSLPGYPVACYLTFRYIVRPYILENLSQNEFDHKISRIKATLADDVNSKKGKLQFVRVRLERKNNEIFAHTVAKHGASNIMSLSMADGILIVPEETTSLTKGSTVEIDLIRQLPL